MHLVYLVVTLALLQALILGSIVGRARVWYNVKAPAITGDARFERLYRIHMNTLELLVILLPAIWMASSYLPPHVIAVLGTIYLAGRVIYLAQYMSNPDRRAPGFVVSVAPIMVLTLAALGGAARATLQ